MQITDYAAHPESLSTGDGHLSNLWSPPRVEDGQPTRRIVQRRLVMTNLRTVLV
jgi:hypothetical protein